MLKRIQWTRSLSTLRYIKTPNAFHKTWTWRSSSTSASTTVPSPPQARPPRNYLTPAIRLLQFACFIHLINEHLVHVMFCYGPSMLPFFNLEGDAVLIDCVSARLKRLKIGDVIVAISPNNPSNLVCKRLLGVAGDTVCVDPTIDPLDMVTIPPGHVWIQGDNMSNSTDSRDYGPLPYALIRGKVIAKVWPEPKWINNNAIQEE